MNIDCYTDPLSERVHISNSQHTNGGVFTIQPNFMRTTTLCGQHTPTRKELKDVPLNFITDRRGQAGSELCLDCGLYFPDYPSDLFRTPTDLVELSPNQLKIANSTIRWLEEGLGSTLYEEYETHNTSFEPEDFIPRWEPRPPHLADDRTNPITEKRQVAVDNIAGGVAILE